ncbi:unnamed protein product [Ectocarpus sp. 12 AP-2014]
MHTYIRSTTRLAVGCIPPCTRSSCIAASVPSTAFSLPAPRPRAPSKKRLLRGAPPPLEAAAGKPATPQQNQQFQPLSLGRSLNNLSLDTCMCQNRKLLSYSSSGPGTLPVRSSQYHRHYCGQPALFRV